MTSEQREVLDCLLERYWKPVYAYVCQQGYSEQAADLTQGFFVHWCEKDLFGRADQARGRFRDYLKKCLSNFLKDAYRRRQAAAPPVGIVSIDQLMPEDGVAFEPAENETPEAIFDRMWVREVLLRVWNMLQEEFAASGMQIHSELFRRRVLDPILNDDDLPPMQELADEFNLPRKDASNRLVTARRAFQRLLREELGIYACTDDELASEMRELFRMGAES